MKTQRFGLLDSAKAGFVETWFVVTRTYDYVAKLVTGRESTDQLSGPIRIAQVSGIVASNGGLLGLINLAAILSVSIGLMNLVPVPMLDGGHLLFYLYEALRGRPLSPRAQEIGIRLGLALVLTVNDPVSLDMVAPADHGQASGVSATAEQGGGAIGIALLYSIVHTVYVGRLHVDIDRSSLADLTDAQYARLRGSWNLPALQASR